VAIAPDGSRRRAKVLSTSALRGRVTRDRGAGVLEIDPGWDDAAAPVLGMRFRPLDGSGLDARVASQDPRARTIEVVPPPARALEPG
jgi:hypothetical protein